MKNAKRSKRSQTVPSSVGRKERHSSARSAKQVRRFGAVPRMEAAHDHTGAFGSFRQPRLVGVSDTVRIANRDLAQRASRELRAWKRSLPKGVKV